MKLLQSSLCWSNTFSFGCLQSRSLFKFILRVTEIVISSRLNRKHKHYEYYKTTEIQIIIQSTEPDQCVHWQTSGHHKNIVLNLIITSLEWLTFHCLFLIAQLPTSALYIIFLSLFIFILSIIHVLVKCLHMRTAESLWGVPRCCRPACATHSASCVPDYQGWGAEETWRKQAEDGAGGEEQAMSVLIKCWKGVNLQSRGIRTETGNPGGGRVWWKRGWKQN